MFTKDFVFGTGISSYQTEGAVRKGKRVPSIWDTLSHEKGAIRDGSDGDTADDFYDRYPEDIALAKKLGIQSFRLSFSWCRLVNPDQSVNPLGVRFYRSVLSEIVKNGMKPLVTIYHWDLPVYLQMIGGWTNPAIVSYFETYVKIIADHFSDLCSDFLTFNEPQCFLGMGYTGNKHAPKIKAEKAQLCQGVHNILLAHARAYRILKEKNPECEVGFVNTVWIPVPEDPADEKLWKSCERKLFRVNGDESDFSNPAVYMDPLYLGHYPKKYLEDYAPYLSFIQPEEMEEIRKAKQTRVYLNIYTGGLFGFDEKGKLTERPFTPSQLTSCDWLKKLPKVLYYGPEFFYARYHKPIVISENGAPYEDRTEDGKVHDPKRSLFLRQYLSELGKAAADGIPVLGYYYWSLLDNFEWADGYTKRFGIVYVNYKTERRIRKDSFRTYQEIIRKVRGK